MKYKLSALMLVTIASSFATTLYANDLNCNSSYGFRVDIDGTQGETICSSSARDLEDILKDFSLSNQNYTDTSAAFGVGRVNDVGLIASYAANSTELVISIPDLDIYNQVFAGRTRKESEDQLEDWLKNSGVIAKVMNYQAKHSATSPITGVGGIMPSLASTDFNQSIDAISNIAPLKDNTSYSNTTNNTNNNQQHNTINNTLAVGVNVGSYSVKGSDDRVNTYTVPLSYSFKNKQDENKQLTLSLPVTMYSIGKAKGYHVGLGAAYRFPISEQWALTPSVRYALTGSIDRATVASVISGSVTSTYQIPMQKFDINIANMVGYYRTGKFKAGEYSFNPNIKQTMLRNGVMFSQPISVKNHPLAIEYSLIDTRYVGGDKPFMSDMQEIGITIGTHRSHHNKKLSFLRAGIGYMYAKESNGVNFNFGYWF